MKDGLITRDDIPHFPHWGGYSIHVSWDYLEYQLDHYKADYNLDMDPDFQRAHVWTRQQQIAFIEFKLRGGLSGKDILFNYPDFQRSSSFTDKMLLVDGKQRLQAVREFLCGNIGIFADLFGKPKFYGEFDRTVFGITEVNFIFHINSLLTRKQVLEWYLSLNAGGTPHTSEEITKVEGLLAEESS